MWKEFAQSANKRKTTQEKTCKNSSSQVVTTFGALAQLAEQLAVNQWVEGSSPSGAARR